MRPNLKYQIRDRQSRAHLSCGGILPINSTITVSINDKPTPCKTTSTRNGDLVEAIANGKKYLCEWFMGKWIGKQIG